MAIANSFRHFAFYITMRYTTKYLFISFLVITLVTSCTKDNDDEYVGLLAETGEEFSGGQTTIFDVSQNAFGFQAPNLTNRLQCHTGMPIF